MSSVTVNITSFILGLWAFLSMIVCVYGGIKYFFARRNKEKEKRAIKHFLFGLLNLIVVYFIYAIVFFVLRSGSVVL
ncbi:hypothetical protein KAI56_02505 [Candidatus Parcubacteria bacterium]|nr:hypothetical protein [Candidatus Parcubacteria bacterium]